MDTSSASVVSCAVTASRTWSRVSPRVVAWPTLRKAGSPPATRAISASVVAPSRLLVSVSCVCWKPALARPSASSSHTNPVRIWCTTCRAASVPLRSPAASRAPPLAWRRVVGNRKSSVSSSSVASMCTISRWSMQKSSTCSRVKAPKAPPSCMVLAPMATLPAPNAASIARPPGTTSRMWPRWDSSVDRRRLTRTPLDSRRSTAPPAVSCRSAFTPSTARGTQAGRSAARRAAISTSSTNACGTATSCSASTGAVTPATIASTTSSSVRRKGCPPTWAGTQATTAEGCGAPGAPKSVTCSQTSAATRLTSSSVRLCTASCVAR
mmetsp:Transcript_126702/g.289795  ORF Transcript_126702/g.289795 Transcript_126702/m.289795 type:complete len:324 (+) Transcript_126702:1191-2162(+)